MMCLSIWARAGICAALGVLASPLVCGCVGTDDAGDAPVESGVLRVPLTAEADGKTYRLSKVRIRIGGATDAVLYGSDDPSETALVASFSAGSYTSDLENYELERAGRDGQFQPVVGELVSEAHHEFSLLNGTTTTISYRFETDGQIVTVGSGSLRVEVEVATRPGACTPLGDDCEPGTWCAPSELTGQPLACVPAGSTPVGEACSSPLDCVGNSSCFDFGDGDAVCAPLCGSDAFETACENGGLCQPQGSDYGVCAPEGGLVSHCPLPARLGLTYGVMDAVFDEDRCTMYVSTSAGSVLRFSLEDGRVDRLLDTGSSLRGLDLSPDRARLVAADSGTVIVEGWQQTRIHVLDLESETSSQVTFPLTAYESGTLMPVFVDDTTVFVSSASPSWGYAPLRRVDIAGGEFSIVAEQTHNMMLATSTDRGRVAYAELDAWNGPFGFYPSNGDAGVRQWANGYPHTLAISRDGERFALPSSNGLTIYDGNLRSLAALSKSWSAAVGVVYSPDTDVLYVAWAGEPSIEAYHSLTLEPLFTIDAGMELGYDNFGPGRLRISQDGKVLLALVGDGVMAYPVQFN